MLLALLRRRLRLNDAADDLRRLLEELAIEAVRAGVPLSESPPTHSSPDTGADAVILQLRN
jgi:hypothetical protein